VFPDSMQPVMVHFMCHPGLAVVPTCLV
jgi:hypothetical protein